MTALALVTNKKEELRHDEVRTYQQRAHAYLKEAGITLTDDEAANIEIADFGLGEFKRSGLGLITYINTDRVCAKELVLFPRQTCPEHLHPPIGNEPGKEETFRCRWGEVYLYVEGEAVDPAKDAATPPQDRADIYPVWHEVILHPGEQYTIFPETKHWFQAEDRGAIVSEFSTKRRDELDIFTDSDVHRLPTHI